MPVTLLKLTFLHGGSWRFLNCENGTKSSKESQMWDLLLQVGIIEKSFSWYNFSRMRLERKFLLNQSKNSKFLKNSTCEKL